MPASPVSGQFPGFTVKKKVAYESEHGVSYYNMQTLRPACTSAQAKQSLRCPPDGA